MVMGMKWILSVMVGVSCCSLSLAFADESSSDSATEAIGDTTGSDGDFAELGSQGASGHVMVSGLRTPTLEDVKKNQDIVTEILYPPGSSKGPDAGSGSADE